MPAPVEAGQPPHLPPPNPGPSGTTPPSIIPDAGVYGAETAAATNAYNNAVAQATARRNSLYNQYGLNNMGGVDPNNPLGQYQQMLGSQATQFMADKENAVMRGLGTGGLANQQLSQDRRAANAQNWGFQNQVGQVGTDYESTLQNALGVEQSAIAQAYNDAIQAALQNMLAQMQAGVYNPPKK